MRSPRADDEIVAGLRVGDEAVFASLLDTWSRSMLHVARGFVSTDASAEEVVQDTWLAVIAGIDRFEGRSSVRTWVYRILVNTAKKRGLREHRTIPLSSVGAETGGPTLDAARFQGPDGEYPGHWRSTPSQWLPTEDSVLAREVRASVRAALETLPQRQRTVITLRDVIGHSSEEVCEMLEISAGNQRVILHRARAAVRAELARCLSPEQAPRRAV